MAAAFYSDNLNRWVTTGTLDVSDSASEASLASIASTVAASGSPAEPSLRVIGTVSNFPASFEVAGLTFTNVGSPAVSALNVYNEGGTVAVSNFPVTQPVSGTVTANQGGAPWSVIGPTYISVLPPSPALGQSCNVVVPANVQWKIKSVFYWLTTSATAANRIASVSASTVASGSPPTQWTMGTAFSQFNQIASTVWLYTFGNAFASAQSNDGFVDSIQVSMPDFVLGPGMTIVLGAAFIQSGDQLSHIALAVEQTVL